MLFIVVRQLHKLIERGVGKRLGTVPAVRLTVFVCAIAEEDTLKLRG